MSVNSTQVTLVGNVVRDPVSKEVRAGAERPVEFRIACNESRQNKQTNEWEDVTSFYQVTVWGQLGANVAYSLRRGERVIVTGTLRIREYKVSGEETTRSTPEVTATAVGHDLRWGFTRLVKVRREGDAVVAQLPPDPFLADAPAPTTSAMADEEEPAPVG